MTDTLSLLLKEAFEKYRGDIAVREWVAGKLKELTYAELWEEVERIIIHLQGREFREAELLGIWGHRNSSAFASVIACLYSGRPFLPLNEKYPAERIRNTLKSARIRRVLDASGTVPAWNALGNIPGIEWIDPNHEPSARAMRIPGPFPTMAYVIGTSGSTGGPKLIPISRKNLTAYLENSPEKNLYKKGERLSQAFDLSFDPALGDILHAFLNGATLCPLSEPDILFLGEYFRRENVDHWFSTPSMIKLAFATEQFSGFQGQLKRIAFIGERLDPALIAECKMIFPGAEIWNEYGPAECTIAISKARVDKIDLRNPRGVPLGAFFPGVSSLILNEDGDPVPQETVGELCISGPQVFAGYLRGEYSRFLNFEGRRFYATGDLVVTDANGEIFFVGRKDHQIKILGQRVELEELEQLFRGVSHTVDLACLPWPVDQIGAPEGTVLAIWGKPDEEELLERAVLCRAQVPDQWVPKAAYCFDQFPLSEHKKQMRGALIEAIASGGFQKKILLG